MSDDHFKTEISNIYIYYIIKETIKQEKRLSWFALFGVFEKAAWEKGKRTPRRLVSEDLPHRSTPIQIQLMYVPSECLHTN